MKRRFNSTGRKAIATSQISIRLIHPSEPGVPKSFEADLSGLKELGVPSNARIYVEPYVTGSSSIMRFPFGEIGEIAPPNDRSLSGLDAGGRVLFRIKVVDESNEVGKILAAANAIRPLDEKLTEDQQRSILPVESRDLGEAIWKLELEDAVRPTLVVSNRIPGLIEQLKTEPFVQGSIIPHAVRLILLRIFDPERGDVTDDTDWVQDWKQWASEILGKAIDEDFDPNQLEERVDEIIEKFVEKSRFVTRIEPARIDGPLFHE